MNPWAEIKQLSDRGRWAQAKREALDIVKVCECCGKLPAAEIHHNYFKIHSKAPAKVQRFVNAVYNWQLVCQTCNQGAANGYENRVKYVQVLLNRWGRKAIEEWLDSAPDEIRKNDRYAETRRLFGYENAKS